MGLNWRVASRWIADWNIKKIDIWGVHWIFCLKLTGGSHPFAEIDGWHATRATRSYEGPALDHAHLPLFFWHVLFANNPFHLSILYSLTYLFTNLDVLWVYARE